MPLVYQQNINEHTRLGIWHITENEGFLLERVVLQNDITHPHKRLQHLSGRYLLKILFPDFPVELIKIADTKKPYLPDEKFHFSISHCGDFAAVIVSKKNRVGVDIELPQEKINRIRHKYVTADEQLILSALPVPELDALTIAWSIKEAMFKWYGNGKVDFRRNMIIRNIERNVEGFSGHCIFSKEEEWQLNVHASILNGLVLAYLIS